MRPELEKCLLAALEACRAISQFTLFGMRFSGMHHV